MRIRPILYRVSLRHVCVLQETAKLSSIQAQAAQEAKAGGGIPQQAPGSLKPPPGVAMVTQLAQVRPSDW